MTITDELAKKLKEDLSVKMGLPISRVSRYLKENFGYSEPSELEKLEMELIGKRNRQAYVQGRISELKSYRIAKAIRRVDEYVGYVYKSKKISATNGGQKEIKDVYEYRSDGYSEYGPDEQRLYKYNFMVPNWNSLPSKLKKQIEETAKTFNRLQLWSIQQEHKAYRQELKQLRISIKVLEKRIEDLKIKGGE